MFPVVSQNLIFNDGLDDVAMKTRFQRSKHFLCPIITPLYDHWLMEIQIIVRKVCSELLEMIFSNLRERQLYFALPEQSVSVEGTSDCDTGLTNQHTRSMSHIIHKLSTVSFGVTQPFAISVEFTVNKLATVRVPVGKSSHSLARDLTVFELSFVARTVGHHQYSLSGLGHWSNVGEERIGEYVVYGVRR